MNKLTYLDRCIRSWGGQLIILDEDDYERMLDEDQSDINQAPFDPNYSVDWCKGIIYAVKESLTISPLLHEMGHVFASKFPPFHEECNELTWFGWEYAFAKRLKLVSEWITENYHYGLGYLYDGPGVNLGELCNSSLTKALTTALDVSRSHNLLIGNYPVPCRRIKRTPSWIHR